MDVVVTVPKKEWQNWLEEGDLPGEAWRKWLEEGDLPGETWRKWLEEEDLLPDWKNPEHLQEKIRC